VPEIGKKPPQSILAEKAVLGACLLNENAIFSAMEFVRPDDFYLKEHGQIFKAMLELNSQNKPCDLVTVAEALTKAGLIDMVGGMEYLAKLTGEVPSAKSAEYYAQEVSNKATIRELINVSQKVVEEGYEGHKNAIELLGDAQSVITKVGDTKLGKGYTEAEKVMLSEFNRIDSLKNNTGVTGIPTFRDLDYYLAGLQKGDMIVLAARTGCGKTSMALNLASQAAVKYDKSVIVFSLEMPNEQLAQRILCGHAKVNQKNWRNGTLKDDEIERLSESLNDFTGKRLFFDDTPGITIPEMRAKCRRLQSEHGLDMIVIDYLQLMRAPYRMESRQQEISEISRSLKALAKEMNVPVLALAQLSRLAERDGDKGPQLSHLRESGAIEQDADVVLFINRKNRPDGESAATAGPETAEIIVAKNRNGPVGTEKLLFMSAYTAFLDLTEEWVGDEPDEAAPW
jgi:replicative DNA helicase